MPIFIIFPIRRLGWEKINSCDELLLVNDSCLGGVFPLDDMFGEMERRGVEAWGASGNHFVMSYFVCVSKKVFSSPEFRYFFENVKAESHKSVAKIQNGRLSVQIGLAKLLPTVEKRNKRQGCGSRAVVWALFFPFLPAQDKLV